MPEVPTAGMHPAHEELQAFVLGTLGEGASVLVERHLADCASCQNMALAAPDDTLITLLRTARQRLEASHTGSDTLGWNASGTVEIPTQPPALEGHPRYQLLRLLGAGGMGTVWLASHLVMGRKVALKVIRPEFLARPGAVERFRREVHAAAKLAHPNIVAAHDAEQAGETHFLVMEHIEGESLAERVTRDGPLPVIEACRAARDAALGLQHAHEQGMVHRDVKPHNLMVTPYGAVKVLDFGLASIAEIGPSGLTGANVVMGTPDYIAPEQAEDPHLADPRSDVYGLGCTLYYLLTGQVPFPEATVLRKLDAHRTRQAESVRKLRRELSPALAAVVAKMMARDPARRYQSAAEVVDALEPFARGAEPPRRWAPRVAAAALLFAALLSAFAVYRIQTDKGELVITAESDDVEVVVKQRGKEVTIIDTKTKKRIPLRSGTYELELKGDAEGLKLDIEKAVLSRGKTVLARVERVVPRRTVKVIEPLHSLTWDKGSRFASVDISPDGRQFLATRLNVDKARIFDARTGKVLRELDNAFVARFTPDGRQIVSATLETPFQVRDIATGKEVRQFGDATRPMWNFALTGSGTRLFKVTPEAMQVWDWSTGKKVGKDLPWNPSDRVLLTPDSKHFLRQSGGKPPLEAIEVETGKPVDAYRQLRNVSRLATTETGAPRLASGDGRDPIQVFDLATGKQLPALEGAPTRGAYLSGDGKRLLAEGKERETYGVWDVDTGRRLATLRLPDRLEGWVNFVLSHNGSCAVFVGGTSIYFFRLTDDEPRAETRPAIIDPKHRITWDESDRFASVNVAPDGGTFLVTRNNAAKGRLYDAKTGKLLREMDAWIARFTPDGKQYVTYYGYDHDRDPFRVHDLVTGKVVRRFGGEAEPMWNFVLTRTGTRLHKVTAEVTQVWDWSTGKKVGEDLSGNQSDPVLLTPDGKHFLRQVGGKPPLEVIEVETGKPVDAYRQLRNVSRLATTETGAPRLASGDGRDPIQVFDLATGKQLPALEGAPTRGAYLSGDGKRLLAEGKERETYGVWDVDTGRRLATLRLPERLTRWPEIALSRDGSCVVFTGNDSIYVYHLPKSP